jgi:excisionase family DNA binding protein
VNETGKKYLTIEEISKLLNVDYQLIYRLVRGGEIPSVRIGRVYRIDSADLDAYLKAQKSTGPSGGICSSCGKTFKSAFSLPYKCEVCGKPICVDCRRRLGVHHCPEHQPKS